MIATKFFIYFLVLLLCIYPASAAGVTLNRWVLTVNIMDDGTVEEIIQTEIENSGSSSMEGFIFDVPSSKITMPNISTFSSTGQNVDLQTSSGTTKVTINFDSPLEAGKKYDARIDFRAENWVVKSGQDYSITIPVEAPMAIVSGKKTTMSIASDPDIRSQVSFPKSVAPTSVEPSIDAESKKPSYKKLLQFGHIVLTWFKLNNHDVIQVKGSYSSDLSKILEADEKLNVLSNRIKDAKAQGKDVSQAELHLSNARDYNNQAIEEFWKQGDASSALNSANYELNLAQSGLSVNVEATPSETKKTPGFEAPSLILILLLSFIVKVRK